MYIYYAVFSILKPNTLDDNLGALTRYALLLLLLPSPSFFFFFFPRWWTRERLLRVYVCLLMFLARSVSKNLPCIYTPASGPWLYSVYLLTPFLSFSPLHNSFFFSSYSLSKTTPRRAPLSSFVFSPPSNNSRGQPFWELAAARSYCSTVSLNLGLPYLCCIFNVCTLNRCKMKPIFLLVEIML